MLNSEASQVLAQGSTAAIAIAFLQQSAGRMIPYFLPAIILIVLDLIYGVRAARFRNERVRFSTGIKKTATKFFSYICWIVVASTMAIAFQKEWIEWAVLGLVFVNEFSSIVGNYLETKGVTVSIVGIYRWIFKAGAEKVGVSASDEDAAEIIKQNKSRKTKDNGRRTQS